MWVSEMADLERIYTIPLRGAYEGVRTKRSRKAVKIVRAFISRHMKAEPGEVSISEELNKAIWKRGIQKPPRKIKVRALKGAEGVSVLLVDEKASEAKVENAPQKKAAPASEKAESPKKEEPKDKAADAPKKGEPKERAPEAPLKKEAEPQKKEEAAPAKEEAPKEGGKESPTPKQETEGGDSKKE
jgi:large subunit ribosomal protein L31e